MPSVRSLIAARRRGNADDLRALAVALAREVSPPPALPADPAALWDAVEDAADHEFVPGTWQEVRAAADHGDLSEAEYEYLAAAVAAMDEED